MLFFPPHRVFPIQFFLNTLFSLKPEWPDSLHSSEGELQPLTSLGKLIVFWKKITNDRI